MKRGGGTTGSPSGNRGRSAFGCLRTPPRGRCPRRPPGPAAAQGRPSGRSGGGAAPQRGHRCPAGRGRREPPGPSCARLRAGTALRREQRRRPRPVRGGPPAPASWAGPGEASAPPPRRSGAEPLPPQQRRARSPPVAGAACAREERRRMAVLKLADQVGTGRRAPLGSSRPGCAGRPRRCGRPGGEPRLRRRDPLFPGGAPCATGCPPRFCPPRRTLCVAAGPGRALLAGRQQQQRGRGHPPGPAALAPRAPARPRRLPPAGWGGSGCWLVSKGLCLSSVFLPRFVAVPYG